MDKKIREDRRFTFAAHCLFDNSKKLLKQFKSTKNRLIEKKDKICQTVCILRIEYLNSGNLQDNKGERGTF